MSFDPTEYEGLDPDELLEALKAKTQEADQLREELEEQAQAEEHAAWNRGYAGHAAYDHADDEPSIFNPDHVVAYVDTLTARKDKDGAKEFIDRVRADEDASQLLDEHLKLLKQNGNPVKLPA